MSDFCLSLKSLLTTTSSTDSLCSKDGSTIWDKELDSLILISSFVSSITAIFAQCNTLTQDMVGSKCIGLSGNSLSILIW